jgi:hypothetical protein
LTKNLIAELVPKLVVDRLKSINIAHHRNRRRIVLIGLVDWLNCSRVIRLVSMRSRAVAKLKK